MNQGPPNWTDAGGDPKSWDAVSHYPPWPPLANRPALAFAKPLSWCHLSWEWVVEERKLTSWSNILSYELREHPVHSLGRLFLTFS